MQAVFHIGHHKTGTTSLQGYLAVNWARLLRNGLLYPWVESEGAAWGQAQLLEQTAADPSLLSANIREPHNAMAFRMLANSLPDRNIPPHHRGTPQPQIMLRGIRNQIELLQPETVVLCSEVMSHFGVEAPELVETLGEPFIGADLGLHVSLRRPDDQITAWHGQALWFGAPHPALSSPDGVDFESVHFDYRAMIEPWLKGLPGLTPRIRPYSGIMTAGGSIQDFFDQWGLQRPEGGIDVPRLNPSLPRALFPLLRAANTELPRPAARTLGPDLLHITDALNLPANSDIEFFGPARRTEMAERFAPINAWLQEITGEPLFDDIDDMARVRPISEDEALEQVLESLSDTQIESFSNPKVRAFAAALKAKR